MVITAISFLLEKQMTVEQVAEILNVIPKEVKEISKKK